MSEWISCKDRMPEAGDAIVLWYPLSVVGWSWCAGEVGDGVGDAIYVDTSDDAVEIDGRCFWFPIPPPPSKE